jgi:putative phosphoribosyl transferase
LAVVFKDRRAAGRELASALASYKDRPDVLVLALPRGGVVVASEIVKALNLPLDLVLVRKIGAPFDAELAIGAVACPDVCVLNRDVIEMLGIAPPVIASLVSAEQAELRRRNHVYRQDRAPPVLEGRTAILVDDGIATGADMRAALELVTAQKPAEIVLAVPVAAFEAVEEFKGKVAAIVCPLVLRPLLSIGSVYEDFAQIEDEEVLDLLRLNGRRGLRGAQPNA